MSLYGDKLIEITNKTFITLTHQYLSVKPIFIACL